MSPRWSPSREWLVAPIAMIGSFWIAFGPLLLGDSTVTGFQDNTHLILPLFNFMSRSLAHGEFPYWCNTLVAGLPLYNSPQLSPLYPFYFLNWGLFRDPVETARQVHLLVFLHIAILYANSYIAMRVLRVTPIAAFVGASIVALGANAADYAAWINIEAPYSWLPLVAAGAALLGEQRRVVLGFGLLAGGLSMLMLASASQPVAHALYVMGVIALFATMRLLWQRRWLALAGMSAAFAGAGILAFGIASPSIVTALRAVPGSIRFIGDFPPVIGWAPLPFEAVLTGQLTGGLAAAIFPIVSELTVGNPYVGPVAITLAIFALLAFRRQPVVLPFAFLAIYALLSGAGDRFGFAGFNYHLPFLGQIREPTRHLVVFVLAVGFLAGFGFDALRLAVQARRGWLAYTPIAVAAASVATLIAALSVVPSHPDGTPFWVIAVLGTAALGAIVVSARAARAWAVAAQVAAAALALAVVVQYPAMFPPAGDSAYFEPDNLESLQVIEQLAKLDDLDRYRVLFEDGAFSDQFWSMNASYSGIRTFQAYFNPLPYQQFQDVFHRFEVPHYYPMLGARYFVCQKCDDPVVAGYRDAGPMGRYRLMINDRAMPSYVAVASLAGTYVSGDTFLNLARDGFDYLKGVTVVEADRPLLESWLGPGGSAPGTVRETAATLNHRRITVTCAGPCVAVFNEYYSGDWRATVNGADARTLQVNHAQMGVLVPAGTTEVDFAYRPVIFERLRVVQRVLVTGAIAIPVLWRRRLRGWP